MVIELLREALYTVDLPTIEDVVAFLRAAPPNPANFRPAQGSLAEVLVDTKDAEFDLATWEAEWAKVEAEMKAIEEADEQRDRQQSVPQSPE